MDGLNRDLGLTLKRKVTVDVANTDINYRKVFSYMVSKYPKTFI